jgi:hypothetical protein
MEKRSIRREMLAQLQGYLGGDVTIEDLITWQLDFEPESRHGDVGRTLRADLDRIALIAEEVADGIRPEEDLRDLALEMTGASSRS